MSDKKTPVYKEKKGSLQVAVWENNGSNGKWPSITFERSYTKNDGADFEHTTSMRAFDLAPLRELLSKAEEFCKLKYPNSLRNKA